MHNHSPKEQINKFEFRSQALAMSLTILLGDLAHDNKPVGRIVLSI